MSGAIAISCESPCRQTSRSSLSVSPVLSHKVTWHLGTNLPLSPTSQILSIHRSSPYTLQNKSGCDSPCGRLDCDGTVDAARSACVGYADSVGQAIRDDRSSKQHGAQPWIRRQHQRVEFPGVCHETASGGQWRRRKKFRICVNTVAKAWEDVSIGASVVAQNPDSAGSPRLAQLLIHSS